MPDDTPLQVPADTVAVELIVRRSRFIAEAARAQNRDEALAFVKRAKETYPDATHHCYAFIAGTPGSTGDVGMSDDGEPHGTAGKPMLSILTHSGIAEIVAVVTRYFGGTKLGTGGLVRAYSASVQAALDRLPLTEKVDLVTLRLDLPYACEDAVRRLLADEDLVPGDVAYSDRVTIPLAVPANRTDSLIAKLTNATNGQLTATRDT